MHLPVLLKESIYYLNPKPGDAILDATIDGGGHAREILRAIGATGCLIGIDQDKKILDELISNSKFLISKNLVLINGNFREVDKLIDRKINGALFDLGMSSIQLEESDRGFSFQKNEPLLMTYKSKIGPKDLTAEEIVNKWKEKEIADVLFQYGEERYSRRIARKIVERRKRKPIKTTLELVEIIRENASPTRTFQALRIAVNDEINALKQGIEKAWNLISSSGRLVIISFHSLEDRAVKNFLKKLSQEKRGTILTKKPVRPTIEEIKLNPRSRSAKLRAIEKIK